MREIWELFHVAVAVAAGLALPGSAWAWLLGPRDEGAKWRTILVRAGHALACGIVALAARVLLLASAGLYTRTWDGALGAALVAGGFAIGWRRERAEVRRGLVPGMLAVAGVALGTLGIMALPGAGEWIVGGWDPGVYVNDGVALSRSGTFYPPPDPVLLALPHEAIEDLTQRVDNRYELFPAVPLDPETRTVTPYFFRMTPMFVAFLDRCGGLRAATRVNYFAGLIAALFFAAFVARLSSRLDWTVGSTGLLLAHPLWLYHLHFPTSEMIQLMLLAAAGLLGPGVARRRGEELLLLAMLFLGVLNRVSFAPFAGLLLLSFAWVEAADMDRRAVLGRRAAQIAALAAGVLFDFASNPMAVGRLRESMPAMLGGFVLSSGCAVALDVGLGRSERLRRLASAWGYLAGLGALAAVVGLSLTGKVHALGLCAAVLKQGLPYLGPCFLVAAAAGSLWMPRDHGGASALRAWSLFLATSTVITWIHPAITGWWPWATRRFVEFTLPWLALSGGALLTVLLRLPRRWSRAAGWCLALALVACTARRSKAALFATEFDGISAALAGVASRISPEQIVVADHFRWATPLRLAWGRHAFAVDVTGGSEADAKTERALRALAKAAPSGLLLLASTDKGISLFPEAWQGAELLWASQPVTYGEVVQHPRARRIRTEEKTKQFRLYRLLAGPQPPGSADSR